MWQQLPKDIRLQIAKNLSIDVRMVLGVSPGKLQVPVELSDALIEANSRLRVSPKVSYSAVWFFQTDSDGRLNTKMLRYSEKDVYKFAYWSWDSVDSTVTAWGSRDNTVYNKIKCTQQAID